MMTKPFAFTLPLLLGVLACGLQQSAVQTAAVDETQAYNSNLATGLALAATSMAFPTIEESPTFEPSPTIGSLPSDTPSPTLPPTLPVPNFARGTISMVYGDQIASVPGQETVIYGFQGAQDDNVAVGVSLSNSHPDLAVCKRGRKLIYYLRTNEFATLDVGSVPENRSASTALALPYTGEYYIYVTCAGSGCNKFCAEVKVSLDKK